MIARTQVSVIDAALKQLSTVLIARLEIYLNKKAPEALWEEVNFSELDNLYRYLLRLMDVEKLYIEELFTFLIALAPHIKPNFFDELIQQTLPEAGDFPQLGGMRGKNHRGFLPTGETALFILAGNDLEKRAGLLELFDQDHFFYKKQVLMLETPPEGEPMMSGKIILSQEYVDLVTRGHLSRPRFGISFPAQHIETELDWDDLVLHPSTLEHINELKNWLSYGHVLMHHLEMKKKLKPGYRSLFHGPPGTGKTLTASLLGKHFGKEVYKIDLSMIVSKYIGETEKNLSNLFNKAENKDWILFFDEADALFGKRTNVKDAHDKYANQEVSYLLQRVEDYDGLVILASNFKNNIDEAFLRRFQSIIHFPMPSPKERLQIWQKAFPKDLPPATDIQLKDIAKRYNLSGSNIINIVQYCCLETLAQQLSEVKLEILIKGIKREFDKEGKLL